MVSGTTGWVTRLIMSYSGFSNAFDPTFFGNCAFNYVRPSQDINFLCIQMGISAKELMEMSLEVRIRSSIRSLATLIRLRTFSFGYKMPLDHPDLSM